MIRLGFAVAAVLGAAMAIWGAAVVLAPSRIRGFGWTAYAPLSRTAYAPPSGPDLPGLALVIVGSALVGAGITGLVLARPR
jgi:heme/copper-type cytochrome/quinol oxidase subunit 1